MQPKYRYELIFKTVVTGALTLVLFVTPFVLYLYFSWDIFCLGEIKSTFCSLAIPNIYTYMQLKFWGVGFFLLFWRELWWAEGILGYITIAMIIICTTKKQTMNMLTN